jgi:CBS domain-containing protein
MASISQRIERSVAVLDERGTALDAAKLMTERNIGSVVVRSSGKISGIFTERDLMTDVVSRNLDPADVRLKDLMRRPIVSVRPEESVENCLALMRDHHCRHMLVFRGDEFVGIVSLRDMVLLMLDEKERLIQDLTRYITG